MYVQNAYEMQNNANNDNEMNMEEEDDTMENDNYQYTGDYFMN